MSLHSADHAFCCTRWCIFGFENTFSKFISYLFTKLYL